MATAKKMGALTDMTLVKRAISNTEEAYSKLQKRFSVSVNGVAYGKHVGSVIDNSIKKIKQEIIKKRDDAKVLKTVNIKLFIHDSATMIDYNQVLPVIDKIAVGIRDFVGKQCRVNFMSSHKKDYDSKFCFEVSMTEGDY